MKITLKNIKHFAAGSRDSNAFTADVYIDGKKEGRAENDGNGGPNFITPRELAMKLHAYGKTLPKKVSDIKDASEPGGFFTYEQTGDSIIGDLLLDRLLERDVKKILSKRVLYTVAGKSGLFQTKPLNFLALETVLKHPESLKAETILNLLPLEEAAKIYRMRAG